MYEVFLEKFRVQGGGPDQLNRCKEAAAGSMLTYQIKSHQNWVGGFLSSGLFLFEAPTNEPKNTRNVHEVVILTKKTSRSKIHPWGSDRVSVLHGEPREKRL